MTNNLIFTHRDSKFSLTIYDAPKDTNGNTRYDIHVLKDNAPFREVIKGFRKVKVGYRVQIGAHGYDKDDMIRDLQKAIIETIDPPVKTLKAPSQTVRSNSKDTTALIREHIIECLCEDYTHALSEQLENVCKEFVNWYGPYEQRRTPNIQQAFMEWLMGLPTDLSVEFTHHGQREKLTEWLGATNLDYTTDVIQFRYLALIFREFNKLCTLNGIQNLFARL